MPTLAFSYYQRIDTSVHRMDARVKLVWLGCVFVLTMIFNNPLYQFAVFAMALGVALIAKLPLRRLASFSSTIFYMGTLVAVMWTFLLKEGNPIFSWGPFTMTDLSYLYGIALGLRVTTLLFSLLVVLMTTSQAELTVGMVKLGMPYSIAFVIILAFRFLPTLMGDGKTVLEAQRSRGFEWDKKRFSGFLNKAKLAGMPIFMRAMMVVNSLSYAMESRAFGAYPTRSYYYYRKMNNRERILIALTIFITALCVVGRLTLGSGAIIVEHL